MIQEGDQDALLIADFEAAAMDLIQEDSDLAVALTAYQQARHKLAEKFRNRGFFPSRPLVEEKARDLDRSLVARGNPLSINSSRGSLFKIVS